jgi:hypothetical protein
MKRLIAALTISLLTTLPLLARGEGEAPDTEAPPWYQFEVIVFERIAKGAGSTEAWPADPDTPSLLDAIPFDTRGSATLRNNKPIPYRPLPGAEQRMGGIWSRFRNSRNYRPLYHIAWRQQMVDPEKAQKLYLYLPPRDGAPASPSNPPLLEGTLKIGVKRYLHVEADLLLREPRESDATDGYLTGPAFNAYRLHEKSRMRSGKLHYLDHPVLGVLLEAEKYQPPAPEPAPEPAQQPQVEPAPAAATPAPAEAAKPQQ